MLNAKKISNLTDKEFKVMDIKIFIGVEKRVYGPSENFNRDRKYKKELMRVEEYNN